MPGGNGDHPGNYPQIKLDEDSGAHILTFDIVGGQGITFSNDPIWVWTNNPTGQKPTGHSEDPQIPAPKVLNHGKQLVVVDWNDQAGTLQYQLNFMKNGAAWHPLDPVIINGGGIKPTSTAYFADVASMLAFTALIALTLGVFLQRTFFTRTASPRR